VGAPSGGRDASACHCGSSGAMWRQMKRGGVAFPRTWCARLDLVNWILGSTVLAMASCGGRTINDRRPASNVVSRDGGDASATGGPGLDASRTTVSDEAGAMPCVDPGTVGHPDVLIDAGSCDERMTNAHNLVLAAVTHAQADLSCQVDSDCVLAAQSTECSFECGSVLLSETGAGALACAIDGVNMTICRGFDQDGCIVAGHPCPFVTGSWFAACVAGTCKNFPPAAWDSFALNENTTNITSPEQPCSPVDGCSAWTVTPDGRVAVTNADGTHAATLSSGDFATVDSILRSESFRQSELSGFACEPASGGEAIFFEIARGGAVSRLGVSGCVLTGPTGPTGNDAQLLFSTLTSY